MAAGSRRLMQQFVGPHGGSLPGSSVGPASYEPVSVVNHQPKDYPALAFLTQDQGYAQRLSFLAHLDKAPVPFPRQGRVNT